MRNNGRVPVAARSKAWVRGHSLIGIVGSNPALGHECPSVVGVVCLSRRGLCDGPIPQLEESYCVYH